MSISRAGTASSKIYATAHEPKRLVVLNSLMHNDMLEGKEGEYLSPVVEYIFSVRPNKKS